MSISRSGSPESASASSKTACSGEGTQLCVVVRSSTYSDTAYGGWDGMTDGMMQNSDTHKEDSFGQSDVAGIVHHGAVGIIL